MTHAETSATPTNLVEEELSLRALTLAKDGNRLSREVDDLADALLRKKEELAETNERLKQILGARFRYLPAVEAPTAKVVKGAVRGEEVRVLFSADDLRRKSGDELYLVTMDLDLPAVNDIHLAKALAELEHTWWIDSDAIELNQTD